MKIHCDINQFTIRPMPLTNKVASLNFRLKQNIYSDILNLYYCHPNKLMNKLKQTFSKYSIEYILYQEHFYSHIVKKAKSIH